MTTPPRVSDHKAAAHGGNMPKPDIVKRATSNQNETIETKPGLCGPSVKRAALNRDSSATANRLKEQYVPNYKVSGEKFDRDMQQLSSNLELSTLDGADTSPPGPVKPTALSDTQRTTTLDQIAMDLMDKPDALSFGGRNSTVGTLGSLALDLEEEPLDKMDDDDAIEEKPGLGRPAALTFNDRLTTNDIMNMVQ